MQDTNDDLCPGTWAEAHAGVGWTVCRIIRDCVCMYGLCVCGRAGVCVCVVGFSCVRACLCVWWGVCVCARVGVYVCVHVQVYMYMYTCTL